MNGQPDRVPRADPPAHPSPRHAPVALVVSGQREIAVMVDPWGPELCLTQEQAESVFAQLKEKLGRA